MVYSCFVESSESNTNRHALHPRGRSYFLQRRRQLSVANGQPFNLGILVRHASNLSPLIWYETFPVPTFPFLEEGIGDLDFRVCLGSPIRRQVINEFELVYKWYTSATAWILLSRYDGRKDRAYEMWEALPSFYDFDIIQGCFEH